MTIRPDLPRPETLRRPRTGAAPLGAGELFFSRTDTRGVIQAANPVFQRVADFSWDDLIGAPHKLIRHPDMPRAVFWLLWQTIEAGQPIGAYVLNKARDGLHYWVFASVTPIEGGYLSVRMKPATALQTPVAEVYKSIRAAERAENLSPAESAALLVDEIRALGYFDYQHFCAEAILAEVMAVPNGPNRTLHVCTEGLGHIPQLWNAGRHLQSLWDGLRYTLVNMRLIGSKLEKSGGPIDLMAQNYTTVLAEAQSWLGAFMAPGTGDLARMTVAVRGAALALGIARVQHLAVTQFRTEAMPATCGDKPFELAILSKEAAHRAEVAIDALGTISTSGIALDRMVTEIRRSCAGLNSTRMMCKADAARQTRDQATFAAVVDALDTFQAEVEACASEMVHHTQALSTMIRYATSKSAMSRGS